MVRKVLFAMAMWSVLALGACSTAQNQAFIRNVAAGDCSSPAAEQKFLANIPTGLITEAQMQAALDQVCMGAFGTVAAPTTAPGNVAAIPPAATVGTVVVTPAQGTVMVAPATAQGVPAVPGFAAPLAPAPALVGWKVTALERASLNRMCRCDS